MADDSRGSELVLPPGTYAFVLDQTKGNVSVNCGPHKSSLSNTDQLVVYDPNIKRFVPATTQNAIQNNIIAPKGCYVILDNPASNGKQPESGKSEPLNVGNISYGSRENLPGPQSFSLWPGQVATVVEGHRLRTNRYCVARVYDDEAAKANWDKSVVKRVVADDNASKGGDGGQQNPNKSDGEQLKPETVQVKDSPALGIEKNSLVTGSTFIVKGTDVAFYIPPTGVEVLKEENSNNYIRDAVTLERLEYAILIGESGHKEYRRGPDVVFPTPTQVFFTKPGTSEGKTTVHRKFRAFELQPTNGIHIKVIADYSDRKAGDEMFITGADTPIYYPQEEHAIISYGGQEKSYAVAIPPGEGRYVLGRRTGDVKLVKGSMMFLPDPIKEVIVRRILTASECTLYYPNNQEVLDFNRSLDENGIDVSSDTASMNNIMARTVSSSRHERFGLGAPVAAAASANFADSLTRSQTYTPPRMITLDTKFDGAVRIDVWTGFAVQVVNSKGDRRTIVGPQTVLLEYDEYMERLSLSKGKPKTNDNLILTPYLQYHSNPVSDIISLKTKDLVNVKVLVKYLVRFESDQSDRWFNIGNYVQYMVDHMRSLVGNHVRNINVQEFNTKAADILRDLVLGSKSEETGARPLKNFTENGMTVYDLEVITVQIEDRGVADMLANLGLEVLKGSVMLERAKAETEIVKGLEEERQSQAGAKAETAERLATLEKESAERIAAANLQEVKNEGQLEHERVKNAKTVADLKRAVEGVLLEIKAAQRALEDKLLDNAAERRSKEEADLAAAHKVRMEAITPSLVEAMVAASASGTFQSMAEHLAPLALVRGESLSATLKQILDGTPFEKLVDNLDSLSSIGKPTKAVTRD